jgi:hypothetical protein
VTAKNTGFSFLSINRVFEGVETLFLKSFHKKSLTDLDLISKGENFLEKFFPIPL